MFLQRFNLCTLVISDGSTLFERSKRQKASAAVFCSSSSGQVYRAIRSNSDCCQWCDDWIPNGSLFVNSWFQREGFTMDEGVRVEKNWMDSNNGTGFFLERKGSCYMGVSKNKGTPKWMVKIMENPTKMDDLGIPLFSETSIWLQDSWFEYMLAPEWTLSLIMRSNIHIAFQHTISFGFCTYLDHPSVYEELVCLMLCIWKTTKRNWGYIFWVLIWEIQVYVQII